MIYKLHDILYVNIRNQGEVPTQDMVIIKIDKTKTIYTLRGVKDNMIYEYKKEYLDVFLRKRFPYGS